MTLLLERGTKPARLSIKTFGFGELGNTVFLGKYEISLEDFCFAAEYVLTNTNLEPNDPRLQFVQRVQSMKEVEGFSGGRRLKACTPMDLSEKVGCKIKVIAMPPGEAPEEIRKGWIDVEIPLLPKQNAAGFEFGVLGGKPDSQSWGGYRVNPDEAICALVTKNTADARIAADWWIDWRENTTQGRRADALVFAKNVCELIP